jgi:hypothetical protein
MNLGLEVDGQRVTIVAQARVPERSP